MCVTKQMIRSLSIFFAIIFGLLFLGCVVSAASGAPMKVLEMMLISEVACGFFLMTAVGVNPRA